MSSAGQNTIVTSGDRRHHELRRYGQIGSLRQALFDHAQNPVYPCRLEPAARFRIAGHGLNHAVETAIRVGLSNRPGL